MLGTIGKGILALLFPDECSGCASRTDGQFLCDQCLGSLKPAGTPIVTASVPRATRHPIAMWMFRENTPIQHVMHQIKYGNRPWIGVEVGVRLGEMVLACTDLEPDVQTIIVPVPLHRSRRFERGYNQSEFIARGVARRTGFRLEPAAVERERATKSQTELSRDERSANVSDAFVVRPGLIDERDVILVDDTMTTGSTLFACANALVRAGARQIQPCAVATAPLRAAMEPEVSEPVIAV